MDSSSIKLALKEVYPTHPEEQRYYRQHYYRYHDTLLLIPLSYIKGKIVVDLGAIPGHLTRSIKTLGAEKVIGLDYDPERFGFQETFAQHGITLQKCDLRNTSLPFSSESVDSILFTEVIEHIPNPHLLITEIFRVLKPKGKLIITTPNINNLANRLRRLFGQSVYPSSEHMGGRAEQQHVHEYNLSELRALFLNKKFNAIEAGYIAGTEKSLLSNTMPTRLPRLVGVLYGATAFCIPPLRSYLFLALEKTLELPKN